MRLLHTSDWHLGATFHERSRIAEQTFFLDWLLEAAEAHAVDAIVVAGDVFDNGNPPAEAQSLYYQFLAKLAARAPRGRSGARCRVVVVGGNHDSPARLDAPREVLACLEATVVGGFDPARAEDPEGSASGLLVPLRDASGAVPLVVAAVPFVHDYRLGVRGFEASPGEQLASMHDAFREVYTRLADKAEQRFPGARLVATGHLTVLARAGARVREEDAIPVEINRVGTLGALAPDVFDPRFDYVALGHIHRGFAVDGTGRVRYSGTPLQVSAVEPADTRQVLLVDLDAGAERPEVRSLPVPQRRRLVALAGSLDEVVAAIGSVGARAGELPPYVTVELVVEGGNVRAEETVLAAARARGEGMLEVVRIVLRASRRSGAGASESTLPEIEALSPERAFRYAWERRFGVGAPIPESTLARFRSLVEAEPRGEDGAP